MTFVSTAPRRISAASEKAAGLGARVPWGFPEFFVIAQAVLPAVLYLPGTQPLRVPIRMAAFAVSLAALGLWLAQGRKTVRPHPSRPWLGVAIGYLALQVFYPTTNTLLAGAAQVMLYLAVMAPVFWAPDLVRSKRQLWRLLAILLLCNGANSVVGILQVYDPDRWLPREFSAASTEAFGGALGYAGPDGRMIVRPPGLSDSPGAVCGPAAGAAVLGLIFCATPGLAFWKRAGSLALAFAGIAAIYLSHVRSSLVVVAGSLLVYVAVLFVQRERKKATGVLALGASLLFGALAFSVALGGSAVFSRFASLFEEDAGTVYYNSGRGLAVEHAFRVLLEQHPLGAGLGRWGMMRRYFGDERNPDSPSIWAEVQFPAWILDGGVVLLAAYSIALLAAVGRELKLASRAGDAGTRSVAAAVLAVNLGTLALVFSYVPFLAGIGMQYWFLAGALHGAASPDGAAALPGGDARPKGRGD